MPPVVSALLALLATLCRSRAALCLENRALRHQLAVYKQTGARPRLRPTDRVFWAWLSRLWSGWQTALTFVQPRTVIAGLHKRFRDHWRRVNQRSTPGRPKIAKDVRELIRTMWQASPIWGAPRIVGALQKLGIAVAKSAVEKYRAQPKKPPSPTWKTFLKAPVQDLVALDFFVVPTVTFRVLFVLAKWPKSSYLTPPRNFCLASPCAGHRASRSTVGMRHQAGHPPSAAGQYGEGPRLSLRDASPCRPAGAAVRSTPARRPAPPWADRGCLTRAPPGGNPP